MCFSKRILTSIIYFTLSSLCLFGQNNDGQNTNSYFKILGDHDGFGTFTNQTVFQASQELEHVMDSLRGVDFLLGGGSSYLHEYYFEEGFSFDATRNNYLTSAENNGDGYLIFFVDYQYESSGKLTFDLLLPDIGDFQNFTTLRKLVINQRLQATFEQNVEDSRSGAVSAVIRELTYLLSVSDYGDLSPTDFSLQRIFFEDTIVLPTMTVVSEPNVNSSIVANAFDYSLLEINGTPLVNMLNGTIDLKELGIEVFYSSNVSMEAAILMESAARGFANSQEDFSLWVHVQYEEDGTYALYGRTSTNLSQDESLLLVYDHFEGREDTPLSLLEDDQSSKDPLELAAKAQNACDNKPNDFGSFLAGVPSGKWWHGKDWTAYCFFADDYVNTPVPDTFVHGLELLEQTYVGTQVGLADGLLGAGFGLASLLQGIEHIQSLNPSSFQFWISLIKSAIKSKSLQEAWNMKVSDMADFGRIVWTIVKKIIEVGGVNGLLVELGISLLKYFRSISGSSALYNVSYIAGLILFEVIVEILTGGTAFAARVASTLGRLGRNITTHSAKLVGMGFNGAKKILDVSRWSRWGDEMIQGMKNFDFLPNRKRTCGSDLGQCFIGATAILLGGGLNGAPIENVQLFDLVETNIELAEPNALDNEIASFEHFYSILDEIDLDDPTGIVGDTKWFTAKLQNKFGDQIELARPTSWFREHRLLLGATSLIHLPEISIHEHFKLISVRPVTDSEKELLKLKGTRQPVTATIKRSTNYLYNIVTDTDTLSVTSEHPFYSLDENSWVRASDLVQGERIMSYSVPIELISVEGKSVDKTDVYNIEVNYAHNYFVGKEHLLVHNSCADLVQHIIDDYPSNSTIFKGKPGSSQLTSEVDELATFISHLSQEKKAALRNDLLSFTNKADQGKLVKRVRAWEALPAGLRREVPNLESVSSFESLRPGSMPSIKAEFNNIPPANHQGFINGLGNVANNGVLSNSLTLNRIPTVSEISSATSRIKQHRITVGIPENKNFGYVEGALNGGTISTPNSSVISSGPPVPPSQRVFDAIDVGGWERYTDSEYKMLNQLARDLGAPPGASHVNPNVSGSIRIVSERPYCASCQGVIQQFNNMFPGIEITLIDGVR